jgi:erythronate-4-phosphate dehydrogenase
VLKADVSFMGKSYFYAMKIIADQAIPLVREAFQEFGETTLVQGRSITPSVLKGASALLVRSVTPVTSELLGDTTLRFLASATVGIEHVDLEAVKERGIHFAFAPGSNANSVAQYVVTALLHLEKQVKLRLSDLTLGIIGVGNVGSLVHRYAQALGIRCVLNDPPLKRLTNNEMYQPLDKLLEAADIVTIHVPLQKTGPDSTLHLVNDTFLRRLKPGAILINSSRGMVVDEQALKAHRHKLGGLVLDVWNNEPMINPETAQMTSIATPHIAGYSFDGKINGLAMIHRAACTYFKHVSVWDPSELLETPCGEIDVRNVDAALLSAVAKAYPIMADDRGLRSTLQGTPDKKPCAFDDLRAHYPRRFEFSHFTVRCSIAQKAAADILSRLGFTTIIDHEAIIDAAL